MGKIRYYIFLGVGLLILGLTTGSQPTLFVLISVTLAVGSNKIADLILRHSTISSGRDHNGKLILNPWPGRFIGLFEFGTLLIAIISAVLIKAIFGWIPGLATAIFIFGYYPLRWDENDEDKRKINDLRNSVHKLIEKASIGQLTKEQLEIQVSFVLSRGLFSAAYRLEFLIKPLLDKRELTDEQYKLYLTVLNLYINEIERFSYPTSLHRAVKSRLESL